MASSSLDNLLHMIWPSTASCQREAAKHNLAHTKEHLDAVASTVTDDSEDLHEEQADWCERWAIVVVRHWFYTSATRW
jgi:hypothetical protein